VLSVKDLAAALGVNVVEVIKALMKNGMMATINQEIDYDTAAIVAADLGIESTEVSVATQLAEGTATAALDATGQIAEDPAKLKPRPPVVTIMGHVDHGKTSLLDAIRQTNVTAGEAGGITQHIGAYQVEKRGQKITFLDTPGHAAFTAMRARGAQVTDIAVIVVAADDGVMPQTIEAIDHARAANVRLIIAINKIDRPDANPDRVKQGLSAQGVLVEDWGGDVVSVNVSARTRQGIDELLDMILLVAELAELKADPDRPAVGTVIEAQLDRKRGPVCTVLVRTGTLNLNDNLVIGGIFGRARAMFNDKGRNIRKAEPATPVEILGLSDVPQAGDTMEVFADERLARAIAMERTRERRAESLAPTNRFGLEDLLAQSQAGQVKELNLIVKADVQGSIGAIQHVLAELGSDTLRVRLIHTGVGPVTDSDVNLAAASRAIIVAFNVRVDAPARKLAENEGVDIRTYQIIYKLTEDIQAALHGLLEPVYQDVVVARAEVRAIFPAGKAQKVAGVMVTEGTITKGALARVVRKGQTVGEGRVSSLRRFKDDVRELAAGFDGGVGIEDFNDFQEGDILETYTRERVS
jgi:translation initiation factor IF-2